MTQPGTSAAEVLQLPDLTLRPPRRRQRPKRAWLQSKKVIVGLSILSVFIVLAVIGPWIAPYDPGATSPDILGHPSWEHWFGTTDLGQDVFSQILAGVRISLEVAFLAAVLSELLSIAVGVTSAYLGGLADETISLLTNVFLVIPVLPLQIMIIAFLGNVGWVMTAVVIAATHWAGSARKLRAQTLSIRRRDFVEAARAAGEPTWRIIGFEIAPNEIAIVAIGFLHAVIGGVMVQTSLAFLGLGNPFIWSWGSILHWSNRGQAFLIGAWWWYVPPGLCLAFLGLAVGLINLGIDEVVNPRLRGVGRVESSTPRSGLTRAHATAPHMGPEDVVAIRNLRVDYETSGGPLHAVRGVDLTLRRHEVLGIVGESGSGKSTTAFAITRLLRAPGRIVDGSVHYQQPARNGSGPQVLDVLDASDEELQRFRWDEVSMVFQAAMNALNPVLTVEAQLSDTLRAHRPETTDDEVADRVRVLLEMVGVDVARARAYPHQLSGGQRQRIIIAMALALEPAVVILDEPTTALDVVVQRAILERLMELRSRLDCSFVFITHDLSLLLEIADRVAVMYAGEIVEVADADAILSSPRHPYTARLLDSFPSLTGQKRELKSIEGSPPDLRYPPPGCPFHERCHRATEVCVTVPPPLAPDEEGRVFACHHPEEGRHELYGELVGPGVDA
jgi:oligopeptide/dipeptide ABC transporter ATP-binding protein